MDAAPSDELGHVAVRLEPSLTAPREARRAIAGMNHLLPEPTLGDLQLIASELVTNSVIHSGAARGASIELRVDLAVQGEGSGVRVSVLDHGHGFEPPRPRDLGRARQWGLHVVDRLSTAWGVQEADDGTEVWAVLPLPPAGAQEWRTA